MGRRMNFTSRRMCKHRLCPAFQQPHPEESPPDVIYASSHPALLSSHLHLPLSHLPEVICHIHSLSCSTLGCCYGLLAFRSSVPFLHPTGASWTQLYHLSILTLAVCIACGPMLRVCKSAPGHSGLKACRYIPSFTLNISRCPWGTLLHTYFPRLISELNIHWTLNKSGDWMDGASKFRSPNVSQSFNLSSPTFGCVAQICDFSGKTCPWFN